MVSGLFVTSTVVWTCGTADDICEDESRPITSTARASTERARRLGNTINNRFDDTRCVSFAEITVSVANKLPLEILHVEHSYSRAVTLRFLHIVQSLDSTRIVSLSEVSLKMSKVGSI